LHPLDAGKLWWIACLAAVEQSLALFAAPDEMAATLHVSDSTPSMRVQRNYISSRNTGLKDAHPLVFQQQLMVNRRSYQRVERVWPGPRFWFRLIIIAGFLRTEA